MSFIAEKCRIHVAYDVSGTPIKHLSERGLSEVLPPRIPRKERATYIPYAFSGDEIRSFFKVCDSLPDIPRTRNVLTRRIAVLVFFWLSYSSGIRTTKVRLLECADMDAGNRTSSIRYSKDHDQHYIALHDGMTDLMRCYGSIIREGFLSRKYFFPAPGDIVYSHTWVEESFRRVWAEVPNNRTAIAYAFWHYYATANINRWIGDGFVFDDKLICLNKSIGHMTLENTGYYYSTVPGLSDIVPKETEDGFNELVPEMVSGGRTGVELPPW